MADRPDLHSRRTTHGCGRCVLRVIVRFGIVLLEVVPTRLMDKGDVGVEGKTGTKSCSPLLALRIMPGTQWALIEQVWNGYLASKTKE